MSEEQVSMEAKAEVYKLNREDYFDTSSISVDAIRKYTYNPYYAGKRSQILDKTFNGEPDIEVFNPNGELDAVLSDAAYKMMMGFSLKTGGMPDIYAAAQAAFTDIFDGGASFFEPVWERVENFINITSLLRIPWDTFTELPEDFGYEDPQSALLQGVVTNKDGDLEYYQLQSDDKVYKIDNILHIKNPASLDIAGDPLSIPIIICLQILEVLWDDGLRKTARVGIPSLFIRMLKDDQPTIDVAQSILENYSSATHVQHTNALEPYTLDFHETGTIEELIDKMEEILDVIYNPAGLVEKSGTLIGGSTTGAERILNSQSNRFLSWFDSGFTELLYRWLILNGFEGYTCRVRFKKAELDEHKSMIEDAKIMYESRAFTMNEIRERLGYSPATDEDISAIDEYHARVEAMASLQPAQNTRQQNTRIPQRTKPSRFDVLNRKLQNDMTAELVEADLKLELDIYDATI